MARPNSGTENGKELAPLREPQREMSVPGSWLPGEADELISAEGFSIIDTLMIGDPTDGKVAAYCGEMVGPGEPVMVETPDGKENTLPTWIFKPVTKTGVAANVTHVIPASHQVHAACARIYKHSTDNNLKAQVIISFLGRTKTAKGRSLNQFRVAEKYLTRNVQTAG
jgi:hypothetical protein